MEGLRLVQAADPFAAGRMLTGRYQDPQNVGSRRGKYGLKASPHSHVAILP